MLSENEKIVSLCIVFKINLITNYVSRLSGKALPKYCSQNSEYITIAPYGDKVRVEKEWLKLIALYNLSIPNIPKIDRNKIFDIEFHKYRRIGYNNNDDYIVSFKKPVYIDKEKEFRLIARYPNYAISKDGRILELKSKRILTYDTSKIKEDVYPTVQLYDSKVRTLYMVFIHRIMATTWCENKNNDFYKRPFVNHIDRNKHNFQADNLEWVSSSSNTLHALSPNTVNENLVYNKEFTVLNVETNQVTHLNSMSKVAEFIGRAKINLRFDKLNNGKVYNGTNGSFLIKQYGEEEFVRNEFVKWKNFYYVVTYVDGREEKHMTIPDLNFNMLGIKGVMEYGKLRDTILKRRSDVKDVVRFSNKLTVTKVEAMDITTGKVYEAKSMREMERLLNVSNTVTQSAYRNKNANRVYLNKYVFKFNGEGIWNKDKYLVPSNLPYCYTINKEKINSLRKLSERTGIDRPILSKLFQNKNEITINNIKIIKSPL